MSAAPPPPRAAGADQPRGAEPASPPAGAMCSGACACGGVRFSLTSLPCFSSACCCNDCVTRARYVDALAAAAGVDNTSCMEAGNANASRYTVTPLSSFVVTRGLERLAFFKPRRASASVGAYTSCCKTLLLSAYTLSANLCAVNVNCLGVRPAAFELQFRVRCGEALRPDALPRGDVVNYTLAPLSVMYVVLPLSYCGARLAGPPGDAATRRALPAAEDVTEVAGASAYVAAGYAAPADA